MITIQGLSNFGLIIPTPTKMAMIKATQINQIEIFGKVILSRKKKKNKTPNNDFSHLQLMLMISEQKLNRLEEIIQSYFLSQIMQILIKQESTESLREFLISIRLEKYYEIQGKIFANAVEIQFLQKKHSTQCAQSQKIQLIQASDSHFFTVTL